MKFRNRIGNVLQKNGNVRNGRLCYINVAKQTIDLNNKAESLKSDLYRSGLTSKTLEGSKHQNQLEAGVIKLAATK